MPTELLYRDTIYCKEWYNAQTNDFFRLFIIPERKIGNNFNPEGGFKLKEIPNSVIKNVAGIERNIGELKIGIMDTPTLEIELNVFGLPSELSYILVHLENDTLVENKEYTNTWILQSDRNSNRTKWFSEFVGIQRKTPGIKSKISRLNADGIPINSELHLILFNIGRAVLENVKMFDAVKKTRDTTDITGLGDLATSGVLTSFPYSLRASANKTYMYEFLNGSDTYQLIQEPVTGYIECYPLSMLYYGINYLQQNLCRKYLRSNSVNVNYNNAEGERRFPHDNIKFRNNNGTAFLNADQLYIIGYVKGGGQTIDDGVDAGGHLDYSKENKAKSLAKYQNVYDFYKDISENFASALVYYDNFIIDVETMPIGTEIITLETLNCIGSLKYNFSRIKENFNTTDNLTSDFDISSSNRNIDFSKSINDSLELEQGATLIRSTEVNIDTQYKRQDDADHFVAETTSILSEQKFEAKSIFDTHLHIPDVFKFKGNYTIVDESYYAVSNLYYVDGTEEVGVYTLSKIYKVHTAIDFIVDNFGTTKTYDNVSQINTYMQLILKSFFFKLLDLSERINYKDERQRNLADMKRNAIWSNFQEDYGLCSSLAKYILDTFSKSNQSSLELSFNNDTKLYPNYVGDYFNLTYWNFINDYMDFINTRACLISIKQNRFTGKTDAKFLTEGK